MTIEAMLWLLFSLILLPSIGVVVVSVIRGAPEKYDFAIIVAYCIYGAIVVAGCIYVGLYLLELK